MAQLTDHITDDRMVQALKKRAMEHGQSAEAERRYFLQKSLRDAAATGESFARRATALRTLLRSSLDSTFLIRRYRDRATRS